MRSPSRPLILSLDRTSVCPHESIANASSPTNSQLYVESFISCLFGGTSTSGIVLNPWTVRCVTPAMVPQSHGWVQVELASSHQGTTTVGLFNVGQQLADRFYYHSPLIVSRVEPPFGPTDGGTTVALYGRFDHLEQLRCRFGLRSEALMVPRLVDATRVECTSAPQAMPALHVVQVTSNGQQFGESYARFTYHSPLEVVSLHPARVKSEGGTLITLSISRDVLLQTHVRAYLFCRFDALATPASLLITDSVLCMTPNLAPGYVTVELTTNGQDYTTTGVQVQIVQVAIYAVQPANGPRLGGTRVVVSGSNLFKTLTCLFRGIVAVATESYGRDRLACITSPFSTTGWVAIELVEGNRTLSTTSMFHVDHLIRLSLAAPQMGPTEGGKLML